jgi:phospholipase D3/4
MVLSWPFSNDYFLAVAERGTVDIRIAQNLQQPNLDTIELSKFPSVQVRSLNFSALVGAGILHTKLWIVDRHDTG